MFDLGGLFLRHADYFSWRTGEYVNEIMKKQGIDFTCTGPGSYMRDRNYARLIDVIFRFQMFAIRAQLWKR